MLADVFDILGSGLLDLECLLPFGIPKIWSHIEFDLCGICAVRHHDGRIAYAASAKLQILLHLDFAVLDKTQSWRQPPARESDPTQCTAILVLERG